MVARSPWDFENICFVARRHCFAPQFRRIHGQQTRTVDKSRCIAVIILIFMSIFRMTRAQFEVLGTPFACEIEGSQVYVPNITENPCITCTCQNKEAKCNYTQQCPPDDGCHYVLHKKPDDSCCNVCKGCYINGRVLPSGSEWTDTKNPCKVYSCQAGVLTESIKRCHVTCKNPLLLDNICCPVCSGCVVGGRYYDEGETFPATVDGCTICTCKSGATMCEKIACPVLNCPDEYVHTPAGACCPGCTGSRRLFDLQRRGCFFRHDVSANNTSVVLDACTKCTCLDGTMRCNRKVCPPLDCATNDIIHNGDTCCPRCTRYRKRCKLYGKRYKHGSVWKADACSHCYCDAGTVRCHVQTCYSVLNCPRNSRLQEEPGKCCPKCIDDGAVCTVFGDPHYKTFDGRIYNFQGGCNYILADDCESHNISIRVRNSVRTKDHYAWTKSVRALVSGTKIYLLQKSRVKINKKYVTLPFTHRSGGFSIIKSGQSVTLETQLGVKVTWDGDSYLEVNVPPSMKNRMCGLCGNYNNDQSDDFTGRDGRLYVDPDLFGNTWLTNRKKSPCYVESPDTGTSVSCLSNPKERRRAERRCDPLWNDVFETCSKSVDVVPYYQACLTDVCECPRDQRCACESVMAFAHACSELGIRLRDWQGVTNCVVPGCPEGATWNFCAKPCKTTCENIGRVQHCHKPCIPKCECPNNRVLHRNRCIRPRQCPSGSLGRKNKRKPKKKRKKKKDHT